jgi:hypothetical protein
MSNERSEFVKSAITKVPAATTQSAIIEVLARYGASGFGFRRRGDVIEATFHLPRAGAGDQTVRIPVNVASVYAILQKRGRGVGEKTPDMAQAERTAWRALLLWIEASLLAVKLGAQSMEEAFFAHLLVTTEDGQEGRMVDYVATLGVAAGGVLPSARRLALKPGEDQ